MYRCCVPIFFHRGISKPQLQGNWTVNSNSSTLFSRSLVSKIPRLRGSLYPNYICAEYPHFRCKIYLKAGGGACACEASFLSSRREMWTDDDGFCMILWPEGVTTLIKAYHSIIIIWSPNSGIRASKRFNNFELLMLILQGRIIGWIHWSHCDVGNRGNESPKGLTSVFTHFFAFSLPF